MAIAASSRRRRWILRVQIIAPENSLSIWDQISGRMKRTTGNTVVATSNIGAAAHEVTDDT